MRKGLFGYFGSMKYVIYILPLLVLFAACKKEDKDVKSPAFTVSGLENVAMGNVDMVDIPVKVEFERNESVEFSIEGLPDNITYSLDKNSASNSTTVNVKLHTVLAAIKSHEIKFVGKLQSGEVVSYPFTVNVDINVHCGDFFTTSVDTFSVYLYGGNQVVYRGNTRISRNAYAIYDLYLEPGPRKLTVAAKYNCGSDILIPAQTFKYSQTERDEIEGEGYLDYQNKKVVIHYNVTVNNKHKYKYTMEAPIKY